MAPLLIASLGMQLAGSFFKGQADSDAAMQNAENADREAQLTIQQAAEDERRNRLQSRKVIGSMRANYGASGVTTEGSVLDILQDSAATAEMDAQTIKINGQRKATALRQEASNYRNAASSATTNALFGALGAGLNTVATMKRT